MAENRTINIKINQNADKAEQSFKSYNKELGNTKKQYDAVLKSGKPFDQQLEDINRIVKETPLNVRDMNKQIQAYQSIALSAGRETPVGKQALEQAAQLRDRYQDIQNETKRLADDQRNLEGAMQGISTGVAVYGGVQSAMALAGTESEQLRETLVRLQAAQTLMNSINQVATALEKESALMLTLKNVKTKALTISQTLYTAATGKATKATKAFKAALITSGIGALVVALGAIVAYWDDIMAAMGGAAAEGQELLNQAIEQAEYANKQYQDSVKYADILRAEGKTEEEILAIQEKKLKAAIVQQEATVKQAKLNKDIAIESTKFNQQVLQGILTLMLSPIETLIFTYNQIASVVPGLSKIGSLAKTLSTTFFDVEDTAKEADAAIAQAETALNDLRLAEAQFQQDKKAKRQSRFKEEQRKQAEQNKKLQDLEKQRLQNLEDQRNAFLDRIAQIEEENYQRTLSDEERELRAVQDKYFELETMAEGNAEALNAIEIARLNEENEIKLKYQQEAYDAKKALDDKAEAEQKARQARELENEKIAAEAKQKLREAQIANVQAGIALFKDIAGENKKLQAIGIAAESAASIAKTIITTQAANAAATAQGAALAIPTAGASVAAAAAAVVQNNISAGISIAAQIAAAAKGISALGGGATPPSGSNPEGAGGGEVISPEFNVVGESGINQLAQLQQQPLQAYVVSGEVTTGQALDRNRVQNATL